MQNQGHTLVDNSRCASAANHVVAAWWYHMHPLSSQSKLEIRAYVAPSSPA